MVTQGVGCLGMCYCSSILNVYMISGTYYCGSYISSVYSTWYHRGAAIKQLLLQVLLTAYCRSAVFSVPNISTVFLICLQYLISDRCSCNTLSWSFRYLIQEAFFPLFTVPGIRELLALISDSYCNTLSWSFQVTYFRDIFSWEQNFHCLQYLISGHYF